MQVLRALKISLKLKGVSLGSLVQICSCQARHCERYIWPRASLKLIAIYFMAISQQDYESWQTAVIENFFSPDANVTDLCPRDGMPSVVTKVKYVLAALVDDSAPAQVEATAEGLAAEVKRSLYHVGQCRLANVKDGLKSDGRTYRYPCFDLGGLTNYSQQLGEAAHWTKRDPECVVTCDSDLKVVSQTLYSRWCALTAKPLPESLKIDLLAWLVSVNCNMGPVTLRFHQVPPEHRVLVTSRDIIKATGRYYLRVFGEESYARASDGKGVSCGVTAKYITPNLNDNNIFLEYAPYKQVVEQQAVTAKSQKPQAMGPKSPKRHRAS